MNGVGPLDPLGANLERCGGIAIKISISISNKPKDIKKRQPGWGQENNVWLAHRAKVQA